MSAEVIFGNYEHSPLVAVAQLQGVKVLVGGPVMQCQQVPAEFSSEAILTFVIAVTPVWVPRYCGAARHVTGYSARHGLGHVRADPDRLWDTDAKAFHEGIYTDLIYNVDFFNQFLSS